MTQRRCGAKFPLSPMFFSSTWIHSLTAIPVYTVKHGRAFISTSPYEMSRCSLDQVRNVWPEGLQHSRTRCVTQKWAVHSSAVGRLLQHNFPMLTYLKVKTCNAFFHMQCFNFWSRKFQFSCLVSLRSAEAGVAVNWPYHPCVVLCGTVPSCWKLAPTCGVWLAFQKMKQKLEAPRQSIVTDSVHDNCQTGSSNTSTGICQSRAHSRQSSAQDAHLSISAAASCVCRRVQIQVWSPSKL